MSHPGRLLAASLMPYHGTSSWHIPTGAAPGGGAWPAANLAIFVPFRIDVPTWVRRLWHQTANTTGNIDIGIYSRTGVRIVSTGAKAQGSSGGAVNFHDVTDTLLMPGDYWMAASFASATAQPYRFNANSLGDMIGVGEMAAAHPLPDAATIVQNGQQYVPQMGFAVYASDYP